MVCAASRVGFAVLLWAVLCPASVLQPARAAQRTDLRQNGRLGVDNFQPRSLLVRQQVSFTSKLATSMPGAAAAAAYAALQPSHWRKLQQLSRCRLTTIFGVWDAPACLAVCYAGTTWHDSWTGQVIIVATTVPGCAIMLLAYG
jgi:hypothetical protein